MTITSVRIYYYPEDPVVRGKLTETHWGFAEWFERRLKPIRQQLGGIEAKGVNIVNFMLYDNADNMRSPNEWKRVDNTFEYNCLYDLRGLLEHQPLENMERLMLFAANIAAHAPWPQVIAVSEALATPLSDSDRASLLPYLRWPRGHI